MNQKLKLAIFDMDGLMFDTERRYCDDAELLFGRLGIPIDMQALYDVIGTALPIDMKRFNQSCHSDEEVHRLMSQATADAVDDMCQNGVPVKKGLCELLQALSAAGVRLAVATSTERSRAKRLLRAAGVLDYFDFVITSADVSHGKPAPDIFLHACQLGHAAPEEAIIFEDSVNGGRAAKAAGISYIIVPDIKQPTDDVREGAFAVLPSLYEAVSLLSL